MDFIERKRSKSNAKKQRSSKTRIDAEGNRIRGMKKVKRELRGMCAKAPPTPPMLAEEDEREAARARGARRDEARVADARRRAREKIKAKVGGMELSDRKGMIGDGSRGEVEVQGEGRIALPDYFMDAMKSVGHRRLTPAQKRCWPAACSGADLLAIAPPGSGKTLAFLLPAIEAALEDQKANVDIGKKRPGAPAALVVAPTRELTLQIASVCNKLKKAVPVRAVAVYGGASQEEQEEALKQTTSHALLVIGTPGRLLAVLESGALQLDRTKMLILDEADRMLALGFEEQLSAIREKLPDNVKGGRQTLLFSATFPKAVRAISKTWLRKDHATVNIEANSKENLQNGEIAEAAHMSNVEQAVHVCAEHKKSRKLMKYITKLRAADGRARSRVLVFANRIKTVQFIADLCKRHGERVSTLHGTMKQEKRDLAMKDFKAGKTPILIATDVAGRGLDIAGLEYVVNWDFPGSVEQYRHRVGRAGRAGRKGAALSFFTRKFAPLADDLVKLLKEGGHPIDPNLDVLARVAAALPKSTGKNVQNADRFAAGEDEPADELGDLEDSEEDIAGGGGGGDSDDDNPAARKKAKTTEANRKPAWWSNDNKGGGKVFKKGERIVDKSTKISIGPRSDELAARKRRKREHSVHTRA